MKDKRLEQLKKEYQNTPIPSKLDEVVNEALRQGGVGSHGRGLTKMGKIIATIAASLVLFVVAVNISPAVAKSVTELPVVGGIVKVLTVKNYFVDEERFRADIDVPKIEGLENKELENSLNQKYLAENEDLYGQFIEEMEQLKQQEAGNVAVSSGYEIITDNEQLLTVKRYELVIKASAAETVRYDTIDKKKQLLITLPSLFKDDSYIHIISENIKEQMMAQMHEDENKIYWVEMPGQEMMFEPFKTIEPDQNFYINSQGNLVIVFDEYQVAPGYMGTPEFIIPTEVLADILVGREYIR
ncbi:DUF3298 and DUF4163 domain-containing protein [Desulfofalx alkaliphila]|uniref:DUF3298 and DUF4163 domain-containing protein n=1 Tax=Desulfofalx alkaliphila TaxID=105483 RepID=UPI0004E17630|nr:DUF3298 and DUF4163 domain-containing protein [Desulfofalx alkaliphila]